MSDIGTVRDQLENVIKVLEYAVRERNEAGYRMVAQALALLRQMRPKLDREKPVRSPTPEKSAKVTAAKAQQIREYAATHPLASYQDIAVRFSTNSGRVSEAMHGKR